MSHQVLTVPETTYLDSRWRELNSHFLDFKPAWPQSSSILLTLSIVITAHGNLIFRSLHATLNLLLSLQSSMIPAKNDNQSSFNSLQLCLHRPRPSLLINKTSISAVDCSLRIKQSTWAAQRGTGMLGECYLPSWGTESVSWCDEVEGHV